MWRASSKSHYEGAIHYFSSEDILADFSPVRTRIITNHLFPWFFLRLDSTFAKQSSYWSFTLCKAEKNALKFYWDFPSWTNFGPSTSTEDGDGLKDKIHMSAANPREPSHLIFSMGETLPLPFCALKPLQCNLPRQLWSALFWWKVSLIICVTTAFLKPLLCSGIAILAHVPIHTNRWFLAWKTYRKRHKEQKIAEGTPFSGVGNQDSDTVIFQGQKRNTYFTRIISSMSNFQLRSLKSQISSSTMVALWW